MVVAQGKIFRSNCQGGKSPGGNCPGGILWGGQLSRGQLSRGELSLNHFLHFREKGRKFKTSECIAIKNNV